MPLTTSTGRPNIVLIVLDDAGFAQLGSFGSTVATPHIDAVAANGLRYNHFHVTGLCSPTRASLLTGRNAHKVGMGFLAEIGTHFPGYTGRIPTGTATLPATLRNAGYATVGVGKWHLTPGGERTAAGPFERWPLGLGFERYYGFMQGETNQWSPSLIRDNQYVDSPTGGTGDYHLTEDLTATAIRYIYDVKNCAPDKPFFLYFATGAMHAPHHVDPSWAEPYRGTFDEGWDRWRERVFARQLDLGIVPEGTELTRRPAWVTAWDAIPSTDHRALARAHEVYSGFLAHTDAQIGRLLAALDAIGARDNTIVMILSDNGTSAEGGPLGTYNNQGRSSAAAERLPADWYDSWGSVDSYPHYSWGWAWAGNTPFRLWKRYAWLGGTRTPLIVSWPERIRARNEVRTQFCHAVDVAPTLLECAGAHGAASDGMHDIDGASFAATFDDASVPSPRAVQYFEVTGSRAIFAGGWKATTNHVGRGNMWEEELLEGSRDFDADYWELHRLDDDFSEAKDIADRHPEMLAMLQRLWTAEATRNDVFPLVDSMHQRDPATLLKRDDAPQAHSVYWFGGGPIHEDALPSLRCGGRLTAHVHIDGPDAEGVIWSIGDFTCGLSLHVVQGAMTLTMATVEGAATVTADVRHLRGELRLVSEVTPVESGATSLRMFTDETLLGAVDSSLRLPSVWQYGGGALRLGQDQGLTVSRSFAPPFRWTGKLSCVVVDAYGSSESSAAEIAAVLRSE